MLKSKIATTIATGALLLNALTPLAFADTTLQIVGNGSSSDNTATVTQTHTNTVVQSNAATVTNNVSSNAKTGGNDANDNTGGNVVIDTGAATSRTDVSNQLNKNIANVQNCACNGGNSEVTISGNGSHSTNDASLDKSSTTDLFQTNDAHVTNDVDSNAKTGNNDANRNTGGDVYVKTGKAISDVAVSTDANANIAKVGGTGAGASNGGSTALRILGNGSGSDNSIDLTQNKSVTLVQANTADVSNDVDSHASTGWNDANDNTGGGVVVRTGAAGAGVDVMNKLNFNAAQTGCGCDMDLLAKIAGNGSYSDSDLTTTLSDDLSVFQDGTAALDNQVDANAKTGDNDAKRNTGSVDSLNDPAILTGAALDQTSVTNETNANVFGPWAGLHIPGSWTSADTSFSFNFDLSGLFGSH